MGAESEVVMAAEPCTVVVQVAPAAAKIDEPYNLKKNRIQVSNTKKPLFFYLNLAKRYIKQHNDVELTALGMAIPTAVTIAEILKANGIAVEKKVLISTVGTKDENKGRLVQKAKLEIVLEKNEKAPINQKTTPGTEQAENQKASSETEQAENQKASSETAKTQSQETDAEETKAESNTNSALFESEIKTDEPKEIEVADAKEQ